MMLMERRQTRRQEPITPLWRLHRQGHEASCDMVLGRGGFEARFLLDGRFLLSHTFSLPSEAIEWAVQKQARYLREGWTPNK